MAAEGRGNTILTRALQLVPGPSFSWVRIWRRGTGTFPRAWVWVGVFKLGQGLSRDLSVWLGSGLDRGISVGLKFGKSALVKTV